MSIRSGDRVSFTLSGLSTETNARRRGGEELAHSAAAVAGAFADVEAPSDTVTRVEAKRELPKLKSRRTFCTWLVILWTACTLSIAAGIAFHLFNSASADDEFERRLARDSSIRDRVVFGLWDSEQASTKLQLQVSVSVALGVRAEDGDIEVEEEDNHFFKVTVDHATVEETEYLASPKFLQRLNTQLGYYGGLAVLSKPPRLVKPT